MVKKDERDSSTDRVIRCSLKEAEIKPEEFSRLMDSYGEKYNKKSLDSKNAGIRAERDLRHFIITH